MSESVLVTILCEDLQTRCFIRQFLLKKGYNRHQLREVPVPRDAGGAGDKWVRERFPLELQAYRSRKHKAATCLIAAIDADPKRNAEIRRKWLNDACREQQISCREKADNILIPVPKRNIETWPAYLRGEDVDEEREKPYLKYELESECRADVANLLEMCNQGKLRAPAPPSLDDACLEAQRLPK